MEPEESTRLYFERRNLEQASYDKMPIVAVIDGKLCKTDEWRLYTEECFNDMLAEKFPEKKPEQYEEPKGTMQLFFERRDEEEKAEFFNYIIEKTKKIARYHATDPEFARKREQRVRELTTLSAEELHRPFDI